MRIPVIASNRSFFENSVLGMKKCGLVSLDDSHRTSRTMGRPHWVLLVLVLALHLSVTWYVLLPSRLVLVQSM